MDKDQIRSIRSWRSYSETSSIPGSKRFISADIRFPVSICYPEGMSHFYEFNREAIVHVDWDGRGGSFGLARDNLAMTANNDRNSRKFFAGQTDLRGWMEESLADWLATTRMIAADIPVFNPRYNEILVGEEQHQALRVAWRDETGDYGGEWVCFVRARQGGLWKVLKTGRKLQLRDQQPMLWRCYNHSCLDEESFRTILSSLRWLGDEHFRSLAALIDG
jgi:hypothetical protein